MNETITVALTMTALGSILSLLVGFGAGWLAKEHVYKTTPWHPDNLHPEFLDEHGNVVPDEILALRFENADTFNSDQSGSGEGWSHPSEWPEEEDD
jgi:hypothetical protein